MSLIVENKYRGSKAYLLAYCELLTAAQYRGTVTYTRIATLTGLPTQGNNMGREVGQLLGEIAEDEHSQGRPLLSAVVVGARGRPGPGFYTLAHQLSRTPNASEDLEFWRGERDAVYAAWQLGAPRKSRKSSA